jgi:hypothetical protein
MATGSPYRRSSDDEISASMGKPQLTQTVSNAYTISPELFEKVHNLLSPDLVTSLRIGTSLSKMLSGVNRIP